MRYLSVKKELERLSDPQKAKELQRFFKTKKGEYGEGDIFLGVVVPKQRLVAKNFISIPLKDLNPLIRSKIHEERMVSLLILVLKFKKADDVEQEKIYNFYLKNTKNINNWDLVDLSAPSIIGGFLLDKERSIIHKLSKSKNLWEKRIAILSTFNFIKNNQFKDSLKISETLLGDKHDLIHKAIGWMLREIGKRGIREEEIFLKKHYKEMPRTMLRYAIERFPEKKRQAYLKGRI